MVGEKCLPQKCLCESGFWITSMFSDEQISHSGNLPKSWIQGQFLKNSIEFHTYSYVTYQRFMHQTTHKKKKKPIVFSVRKFSQ